MYNYFVSVVRIPSPSSIIFFRVLYLVKAANFPDLFESRQDPGWAGLQFFNALVQPFHLLSLSILSAAVVKDLDVGRQGLVHDVDGHIGRVGQVPEQGQYLEEKQVIF